MALEHLLPVLWPNPSRSPSSFDNFRYKSSFSGQMISVKEFLFAWEISQKRVHAKKRKGACEKKEALVNTLKVTIRP
jgi:hypothetical protein